MVTEHSFSPSPSTDPHVVGLGIDVIAIARIAKALERTPNLRNRLFTTVEQTIALQRGNPESRAHLTYLAGRFAVKEAVAKAIGTGFRRFSPADICVRNDEQGKPYVVLGEPAANVCAEMGITQIVVSISTTREQAFAQAIACSTSCCFVPKV